MLHQIVITGAPASGKTLFFERVKTELHLSDFIFFDELARQLLEETPSYRSDWNQFHIDIYNRQLKREDDLVDKSFITDRGTVDTFAFYPETATQVNSSLEQEYKRYSAVILLESSANLGSEFYKTDKIRNESLVEAKEIENKLKKAWSPHPDFHFVHADHSIEKKFIEFKQILMSIIKENN